MITIEAPLSSDAQYRTNGPNGPALVMLEIETAGTLFEVSVPFGHRPEAHLVAQDRARLLRRGWSARVVCAGLWHVSDHGKARFVARVPSSVVVEGVVLL